MKFETAREREREDEEMKMENSKLGSKWNTDLNGGSKWNTDLNGGSKWNTEFNQTFSNDEFSNVQNVIFF